MISPTWLWLRRGTGLLAFPALLVVHLIVLFSRHGWGLDRDWALGLAAGGTVVGAPLIAGVVAFDRARRFEPTFDLLSRSSVRGRPAVLGLVVAAWLWAVAAWLVTAGVAFGFTWKGGAVGPFEPWTFAETPALLAAAVALGYAVGAACAAQRGWSLAAGPVAAISILLVRTLSGGLALGVEDFLVTPGGGSTKLLVDRDPTSATALIAVHLAVAVALIGVTLVFTLGSRGRAVRGLAIAVALGLTLTVASHSRQVSSQHQPYRWTTLPQLCLPGRVTVCGPKGARPLLAIAQNSLAAEIGRLSGRGIVWQIKYELPGGRPLPATSGVLNADPENVHGGRLGSDDVLYTLSDPRLCAALLDAQKSIPLNDDQQVVMNWVRTAGTTHASAPAAVQAAYTALADCDPLTEAMP